MRRKDNQPKDSAEKTVREIRRVTRRRFSAEKKIRIVLEGLRGEQSIAEPCRKLKLFADAFVAIDGSKFKAVNNRDRNFTKATMKRRLQQINVATGIQ